MSEEKSPSSVRRPDASGARAEAASAWLQLDDACDRYEAAWQAGEQPQVEDFLTGAPAGQRDALLRELLKLETHYRRAAGDPPTVAEWRGRFPAQGSVWLQETWRAAMAPGDAGDRTSASSQTARAEGGNADAPPATLDQVAGLPQVPGYEVLELLGRGGMGVVYKARHRTLDRLVALKMVSAGDLASPETLERFRAEARAVASLQHPHLVQIYEVGEHAGRPYLAFEYVAGGGLDRHLSGEPCRAMSAARLIKTLAHTMHFAHSRGIIHRDLKPANILLAAIDAPGEEAASSSAGSTLRSSSLGRRTSSSRSGRIATTDGSTVSGSSGGRSPDEEFGRPKIGDFGLAKQLEGDLAPTRTGAILGTPSYMAPEQAAGQNRLIGPATDVYALGAILYEMLTGRPPFRAPTVLETLDQVRSADPAAPRRLQPTIPRDLETICLKCLQKEPERRYQTAGALADDLDRWLRDEPVLARPVGVAERSWRWCRRHPLVALLAGSLAVVTLAGFVGVYSQWRHADTMRKRADANAVIARAQRDAAHEQFLRAEENARRADESRRAAEAARDDAEENQQLAEKYLAQAEARFAQSRVAVKEIFAVGDELVNQPRMEGIGRKVLEKAIELQESLLNEKSDDDKVRWETARHHKTLAWKQFELGHGEAAEERTLRAIALLTPMLQESGGVPGEQVKEAVPERIAWLRDLRASHTQLGFIRWERRDFAGADEAFREGARLAEHLASLATRDPYDVGALGHVLTNWGAFLSSRGETSEAVRAMERAIELLRPLAETQKSNDWYRAELALALASKADYLWPRDRVAAEQVAREALAIRAELLQRPNGLRKQAEYVGRSHQQVAAMCLATDRAAEAEQLLAESLEILTRAASNYPEYRAHQPRLAQNFDTLISLARKRGDAKQADQLTLRRSMMASPPVEETAATAEEQARFARYRAAAARIQARAGFWTNAVRDYDVAIEHFQRLDVRFRDPRKYGPELLTLMNEYCRLDRRAVSEARALQMADQRAKTFPENAEARQDLAWRLLAASDTKLHDPQRAVTQAQAAVDLEPSRAIHHATLGTALFRAGQPKQSRTALLRALELDSALLAWNGYLLAAIAQGEGRSDEARTWFERAAEDHCTAHAEDPNLAWLADELIRQFGF